MIKQQFRAFRCFTALAAMLGAAGVATPAQATDYTEGPSFLIRNQSGLSTTAKFYYLGFGQIGNDFVILRSDGNWRSAGSEGTGWLANGWNQTPPSPQKPGPIGAGVVPCYPLTPSSTVKLPPNISGARFYLFQVNSGSKLYGTPCNATPSSTQTNGIFGNALNPPNASKPPAFNQTQAPFSYFSTTGSGQLVTPSTTWIGTGAMPIWSFGEIGSGAAGPGTIDASQVDFIGFPINVTSQMTALPPSYPKWQDGVGFSFSDGGQVNMAAVTASYASFVKSLPAKAKTGTKTINIRRNFAKLSTTLGTDTVLFNPGNYLGIVNGSAFTNFFTNLIDNYIWNPGWPSKYGTPAVAPWTGTINTGGAYGNLPQVDFKGTAVTLPANAYPGYTGKTPLRAIRFTARVDVPLITGPELGAIPLPTTEVVAYVLSPTSYKVLCNFKTGTNPKTPLVTAGCGSPAAQVFAGNGALATPGDNNQFLMLSTDERNVWNFYFGGVGNYNAVAGRLGFILSTAFNRGVAGGLTTPGGLCHGSATLNDCWNKQEYWYPTPQTASEKSKFFMGDTTQNHFARWLHTAQIPLASGVNCTTTPDSCIPMMSQPINPTTLTSGAKMGMGYGFSNDENPTPQPPGSSQTPSKYDGIVEMNPPSPQPPCYYITIMPWQAGTPNPTPVTAQACNPAN